MITAMAKKSYSTRIRVTKTGKLLRRRMAQGHFRSKKTGKQIHKKRSKANIDKADEKRIIQHL